MHSGAGGHYHPPQAHAASEWAQGAETSNALGQGAQERTSPQCPAAGMQWDYPHLKSDPQMTAGAPAQPARALHGFSQVGQAARKILFGAPRQVDARACHARPQQPLQHINLRALQGTAMKQFSDVHD